MIRGVASLALTVLLLGTAGCISTDGADAAACEEPSVHLTLALDTDGLEPASPSVCRDQEVHLSVESELDGILHIHGYDAEVPAFEVRAGETTEIPFTASRSGQFPVEFHASDDPRGVGVGVFTVHEP